LIAKFLYIFVLLKLLLENSPKTYAQLCKELGMSASEIHAAVRRSAAAGLVDAKTKKVHRDALTEYLLHGVRYAFPVVRGGICRGVPTAHAAPPLSGEFQDDDLPPVWADPEGTVRGYAVTPLHSSAVEAVRSNHPLYQLLALVDALRCGRARERAAAVRELKQRFSYAQPD
jgi:DNA-binding Lrp family transcriptional regulator